MASPSSNSNFELENVTLDEPKKPRFPMDVAEQTVLLATTREHFQVIQVLNIALLVVALMVPFVPLWCKYQGVHIGLNQMMLGEWMDLGKVTTLVCVLLNVNEEVCMSATTFYHAGITVLPRQFEVMWVLAMLLTLYNIANLHSRIHAKHWKWSEFEVRDIAVSAPRHPLSLLLCRCTLVGGLQLLLSTTTRVRYGHCRGTANGHWTEPTGPVLLSAKAQPRPSGNAELLHGSF